MKAAVCVVLLLTLYQGEALTCNYCDSKSATLCTPTSPPQTCTGTDDACAAVSFTTPISYSFRKCSNMAACQAYITTPIAIVKCCSTDLCN